MTFLLYYYPGLDLDQGNVCSSVAVGCMMDTGFAHLPQGKVTGACEKNGKSHYFWKQLG
jgi:hypothetical protein